MASREEVLAFLREHKKDFTREQLRAGLLEQGVDAATIDAALKELDAPPPPKKGRPLLYAALVLLVPALWIGRKLIESAPPEPSKETPELSAPSESAASTSAPTPAEAASPLEAARARYRKDFFDPYAHMELVDQLWKAGRKVDAFYVLEEARGLFAEEDLTQAHNFVLIAKHKGGWPGTDPFDGSPAHEATLRARVQSNAADWESLSYLGHIAGHRGDLAAAESYVDKALKLAPADPQLAGFKAHLRLKAKDVDGALTWFKKAYEAAPTSIDGRGAIEMHGNLAEVKSARGEGARKWLEKESAARPEDQELWLARAFALGAMRDFAGVKKMSAAEKKKHPGTKALLAVDALIAIQEMKPKEADGLLKAALENDPENVFVLSKLASLHMREFKDLDGAIEYYLALHHGNPHFYDGEYAEYRLKKMLVRRRESIIAKAKGADDLRALIASEDGSVRAEACLAAGASGDVSLIPELGRALGDDVGHVTQNADSALFTLAKTRKAEVLAAKDSIVDSPADFVRGMSLNLYCDLDKPGMRSKALERLKDPSSYVRWRAYMALTGYYRDDGDAAAAVKSWLSAEQDPKLLWAIQRIEQSRKQR